MESFKLEIKHLDALQKKIEGIEAASEKAVKRLVSDFKTRAPGWVSTAVTNVYGIKKADIKQSLRVRRSRDHSTFKLGGITVDNFTPKRVITQNKKEKAGIISPPILYHATCLSYHNRRVL